ncbi:MAG: metallophosphoesterase [Pseudomonadota bacterium]
MSAPRFTFALIADTHLNPEDGVSSSPWRSNALANQRARWAVAALNADRPTFVIHLGDMVHPIPAQPGFLPAVERFDAIFDRLEAPLHLLPGNHDIGDKPGEWMPAHTVTNAALESYTNAFGPLWHSFDHGDCRFILHCNPICGADLDADSEQWRWLEASLAEAKGRRIFFMTHYPLFLTTSDEPEHYDNLAPTPRAQLKTLLLAHGVEAIFAAHVHTLFHTRLSADDGAPFQHVAPALSALRLDYSHLFATPPPPDDEFGRNDSAKLGYYLVDVFDEGYRIRFRRSNGAVLDRWPPHEAPAPLASYTEPLSARPIGVDLRQGWAQPLAIPYTGVVDEFRRKYVHNDYLTTALQEAGLRDLRVPIDDVLDTPTRRRLAELHALGHRVQVFTIDPPDERAVEALTTSPQVIDRLEIIARPHRQAERVAAWRTALGGAPITLLASPLWTSADAAHYGASYTHGILHGFAPTDHDAMADHLGDAADGVMVRIGPDMDPADAIAQLPQAVDGALVLYVTLTAANPAHRADDDAAQSARAIGALKAAGALPQRPVVLFDTLQDFDRGYYPRNGFYDGRFNPRPLAHALSKANLDRL